MVIFGWKDRNLNAEVSKSYTSCEVLKPTQIDLITFWRHDLYIMVFINISSPMGQTLDHLSTISSRVYHELPVISRILILGGNARILHALDLKPTVGEIRLKEVIVCKIIMTVIHYNRSFRVYFYISQFKHLLQLLQSTVQVKSHITLQRWGSTHSNLRFRILHRLQKMIIWNCHPLGEIPRAPWIKNGLR